MLVASRIMRGYLAPFSIVIAAHLIICQSVSTQFLDVNNLEDSKSIGDDSDEGESMSSWHGPAAKPQVVWPRRSNNRWSGKYAKLGKPRRSTKRAILPEKKPEIEPAMNTVIVAPMYSETGCGSVPMFEKAYHRSINISQFKFDQNGDFRILHGLDAIAGEWPWIVKVNRCARGTCSFCTGTLLNSRWIITAGHCGEHKVPLNSYSATFGLYDLLTPDKQSFEMKFDKKVMHPDYKDLNNDLSLFRLDKPVQFSDYIQPACLVGFTKNVVAYASKKKCFNVGYGLGSNMIGAVRLQKLQVVPRAPNDCNSDVLNAVSLRTGTVCIGPADGKIGASCQGDSGGPNLCYDPKMNRWTIFATVSYGPADCDREAGDKWLTVSVDLSNYRSWIMSVISDLS